MDDREFYFATSLANPKVRSALRGYIPDIEWSTRLAESVASHFIKPSMDGQLFAPHSMEAFMVNEFTKGEIADVIEACSEHTISYQNDVNDSNTNEVLESFKRFYQNRVVQRLIREYQFEPEKIIEGVGKLKEFSINSIPLYTLGDLDVAKVIEEDMGNFSVIPSQFDFVRKASGHLDGYATGQLCMVCAPPGVGKTLFLAHEVVFMMKQNRKILQRIQMIRDRITAKREIHEDVDCSKDENEIEELNQTLIRVFWIALGDMTRIDFITRLTAIYRNIPFNKVAAQPQLYFDDEVKELFKYVKISVLPAATVDVFAVKNFLENHVTTPDFDPNVVIIDYDANLITHSEGMYQAGEEVYNVATSIARPIGKPGKLVFIASQPKIGYWDHSEIPKEGAAESSRKQAIIDMMITLGRNPAIKDFPAGVMLIAKMRRGQEGVKGYYRLDGGHFRMVDRQEYGTWITSGGKQDGAVKAKYPQQQKFKTK